MSDQPATNYIGEWVRCTCPFCERRPVVMRVRSEQHGMLLGTTANGIDVRMMLQTARILTLDERMEHLL